MKIEISNILKNHYCDLNYSYKIINNLINHDKTNIIKEKYNNISINQPNYLAQLLNIININLLYLGEEKHYHEIINDYNYCSEDNYSILDNILLNIFIGENTYIVINNGEFQIVEESKLFKKITQNFGNIKFFSIGEILKTILPKEILKKIKNIKKDIPKNLKTELNDLNNLVITIDKKEIINYKSGLIGKFLFKYTDEIEKILIRKGNIDEKFIKEYAEKLNDSLYRLSGMPQLYTK